jgi:hypothetical protein
MVTLAAVLGITVGQLAVSGAVLLGTTLIGGAIGWRRNRVELEDAQREADLIQEGIDNAEDANRLQQAFLEHQATLATRNAAMDTLRAKRAHQLQLQIIDEQAGLLDAADVILDAHGDLLDVDEKQILINEQKIDSHQALLDSESALIAEQLEDVEESWAIAEGTHLRNMGYLEFMKQEANRDVMRSRGAGLAGAAATGIMGGTTLASVRSMAEEANERVRQDWLQRTGDVQDQLDAASLRRDALKEQLERAQRDVDIEGDLLGLADDEIVLQREALEARRDELQGRYDELKIRDQLLLIDRSLSALDLASELAGIQEEIDNTLLQVEYMTGYAPGEGMLDAEEVIGTGNVGVLDLEMADLALDEDMLESALTSIENDTSMSILEGALGGLNIGLNLTSFALGLPGFGSGRTGNRVSQTGMPGTSLGGEPEVVNRARRADVGRLPFPRSSVFSGDNWYSGSYGAG